MLHFSPLFILILPVRYAPIQNQFCDGEEAVLLQMQILRTWEYNLEVELERETGKQKQYPILRHRFDFQEQFDVVYVTRRREIISYIFSTFITVESTFGLNRTARIIINALIFL